MWRPLFISSFKYIVIVRMDMFFMHQAQLWVSGMQSGTLHPHGVVAWREESGDNKQINKKGVSRSDK